MRKINANLIGIDQGEVILFSDFEDDGAMWTGTGPRVTQKKIKFSESFQTKPNVTVALSMWDMSHLTNSRVDVQAESVTQDAFVIVFRTWSDTRIARVRVAWQAIGAAHSDEVWEL